MIICIERIIRNRIETEEIEGILYTNGFTEITPDMSFLSLSLFFISD